MADQDQGRILLGGLEKRLEILGRGQAVTRPRRRVRQAKAGAIIGAGAQALSGHLVLHHAPIGREAEGAGLEQHRRAAPDRTLTDEMHAPAADIDQFTAHGVA